MNWEMIGALGEIAGAVAVVASLVYLARQVQFSNRLAQAEAWRQPISDLNDLNATFGMDPTFREGAFRIMAGAGAGDLESDEAKIVEIYVISCINCYEQLFREVRRGVLEESALTEFPAEALFGLRFTRDRWPAMRIRVSKPFVEYIEGRFDLPKSEDGPSPTSGTTP